MMKYKLIPEDDKRLRTIVHNKHKITKKTEDLVYNMIMVMKKFLAENYHQLVN